MSGKGKKTEEKCHLGAEERTESKRPPCMALSQVIDHNIKTCVTSALVSYVN